MQNVYKLNAACTFYPYDGHADEIAYIVRVPDNRHFKISPTAKDILLQLDGRTTLAEIAATLNSRSIEVSADDLRLLMTTKYHPLGIVEDVEDIDGGSPLAQEKERKTGIPLLFHWDLIPAHYVSKVSSRLTFMFSKPAVVLGLCSIIAAHYLVYWEYSASKFLSHAGFIPVLLFCLLSVLWHELGHSSAVSRYGGSPGKIGFGLFVLLPTFYADVSEIWRFPRKQRMIVDLGGVYFQELFFAASAVLGVLTSEPEFFVVCRFIDLMVLLTLNPVVQFDGYWLLADWLALPKLYQLGLSYLATMLKRLFGRKSALPLLPPLPRHGRLLFVTYAMLSNLFLVGVAWMSYRYVYSTLSVIHLTVPATFNSMLFAVKAHDLLLFTNRLISLFFFIAFPVTALVGIYRYGAILALYCHRKVQAVRRSQKAQARTVHNIS